MGGRRDGGRAGGGRRLTHPHVLEFLLICHGHGEGLLEEFALVAIVHLQCIRRHPTTKRDTKRPIGVYF